MILVLCLTVFLGFKIRNLTIDADIIGSLPDDDKDAVLLREISDRFGGNNMGVLIMETDDIYQTEVLEHIRDLTDSIGSTPGITTVTSLTNIINIQSNEYGIEIGKLVDEYNFPQSESALRSLRNKVEANDLYKGSIVSEDGKATLIVFTLSDGAEVKQVAESVRKKTESLDLPENIYFTGSPMLVTYISDLMTRDLTRLLPVALLLITLILALSFRSIRGVVLPLITAVIAILWTLGIMALLDIQMSMISNNIPIILLAVGSAYTIHVVNRVYQIIQSDQKKAVREALGYVFIPVILAAITTMIGFVSFIFGAYLEMIREFGIFTALGTFFACLLTLFFIPSLLTFFPYSDKRAVQSHKKDSYLSGKVLKPLNILLFRHPKAIIIVWLCLILLSLAGIFFIQRSVDIREYFRKDDPTRKAENIMIDKFGGTKPVFVLFKGDMKNPELLKTMMETEAYMEQSPDISNTQSVADLIAEINGLIGGEQKIPDDQDRIEQLWFLLEGNEMMSRLVTEDLDQGIIMSRFLSADNESKKEFVAYMQEFIESHASKEFTIEITGMPFVDITMDRSLINSQIGSLAIAIIFVVIVVGLILRSLRSGLLATFPIVASILILFGVMGLTGIPLNIGTVLVASVALGIGIDYAIHVISHFNHIFKTTGDAAVAMEETIMVSGKAILINVFSVAGGFLVLIFSQMVPLQYFGLLIALSMVGSSQSALTLLPALLILVYRKN
ncbi:MAG: RND family transporter [Bacteroidales bacterium]|nr:RND family transporter [Bacteroidales bacterium]